MSVALLTGLLSASGVHSDAMPDDAHLLSSDEQRAVEELNLGHRVFHRKCKKCHGSGREGAPVVGRPGDWDERLEQSTEVLIEHAIKGHQGSDGRMPPKGDFGSLSDADVAAAVRYIVERGEWLGGQLRKRRVACPERRDGSSCTPAPPGDRLLLELLWTLQSTSTSN